MSHSVTGTLLNFFAISGVLRVSFKLPIIPAGIFGSGSAEVHCKTSSSPSAQWLFIPTSSQAGRGLALQPAEGSAAAGQQDVPSCCLLLPFTGLL